MTLKTIRVTREEMEKRVARFSELKGFDGGLPDSNHPKAKRTLYNAVGFQSPAANHAATTSPVGDDAAKNASIKISEGFNLGYCHAKPGCGPMMHNHDTNETFIPMTGRWKVEWEVDGKVESFELGPHDVISVPAGVQRRFENITFDEPDKQQLLMFVISGNQPQAEFSEDSMAELKRMGLAE